MRTLIAGLGNVFHGDDGVGVEVVQELAAGDPLPDGVELKDVGIRGVHLAYELLDRYDLVVLVDAVQRGGAPGTVHLLVHDADAAAEAPPPDLMDAHDMAPDEVLAMVPALGGTLPRVVIVGCEIASVEPCAELTPAVAACVPTAAFAVREIVRMEHRVDVSMEIGGR